MAAGSGGRGRPSAGNGMGVGAIVAECAYAYGARYSLMLAFTTRRSHSHDRPQQSLPYQDVQEHLFDNIYVPEIFPSDLGTPPLSDCIFHLEKPRQKIAARFPGSKRQHKDLETRSALKAREAAG